MNKEITLLTVEIGFGSTKIIAGEDELKFPSVIGFASQRGLDLGRSQKTSSYPLEGENYVVGADAEGMLGSISLSNVDMLIKYSPLFVMASLDLLKIKGNHQVNIATGLPLLYYSRKNELLKAIKKSLVELVDKIYVYPQGVGILVDCGASDNAVIVDIGCNTVDVVVTAKGKAIREESFMLENWGLMRIIDELIQYAGVKHRITLVPAEAQNIFRSRKIKVYGVEHDISEQIKSLINRYTITLTSELNRRLNQRLMRADRIILAGGGAHYIKSLGKDYDNMIYIPKNPEFSNARGFHKYAEAQLNKGGN